MMRYTDNNGVAKPQNLNHSTVCFLFQIHAPYIVLKDYSEILKLRMPMKVGLCYIIANYTNRNLRRVEWLLIWLIDSKGFSLCCNKVDN